MLFGYLLLGASPSLRANASVSVDGFGLFGNSELRNSLRLLEIHEGELTSKKIDDGAFLILTRLAQNGYLDAQLTGDIVIDDETIETAQWKLPFEPQVPEGVVAKSVRYHVEEGLLYYYDEISFRGLNSITEKDAILYFIPSRALFSRKKDRSYSPNILAGHRKQLTAALSNLGYTDAKVTAESIDIDKATGEVDVILNVEEGPLYKVVEATAIYSENAEVVATVPLEADHTYSRNWVDSQIRNLRNESYRLGYPDTKVTSKVANAQPSEGRMDLTVTFEVKRGPKIYLSDIEHVGATDTHHPLLDRKVNLKVGEPLDITKTEAARRRLSALGLFNRIELRYAQTGDDERSAIYEYTNGRRIELQLLLGYGSYESLRGGFIASRQNLFKRAHSLNFEVIQSVKSTSGKIEYKIPELLGESINGNFEALYLDREEVSFNRTERGLSAGLSTRIPKFKTDLGLDYAFERKRSSDPQFNEELRLEDTNIGSISARATRSTLDNILYPTEGYELSGAIKYAAEALGGETAFIKPEVSAALHFNLDKRWRFHFAGRGGTVSSPGYNKIEIPNGERFLVGGENSLRGYQRGEAGPIDEETGVPLSAEAYALLSAEVEYPLVDKLYFVVFTDAARIWRTTGYFEEYEDLYNVGIGFRYQTIVGPLRLEYGHNLNPRPDDPDGTLHLSVGFPF